MLKIGSCTVIYNPGEEVISNIEKYCDNVDFAVVVDNSDSKNEICNKLRDDSRLHYLDMDGNKGIAATLNRGFEYLNKCGVDFVLTMDQDSIFPKKEYFNILKLVEKYSKEYSIISLRYDEKHNRNTQDEIITVPYWITSGNFVNIKDFYLVGGFREDLFIDNVDHDFDHSLFIQGKKVGILTGGGYLLGHKIGNPKEGKIFGLKFTSMNHSPIRYYYRYRNLFYLSKRDRVFYKDMYKQEKKNFIKMLLVDDSKLEKLKMIIRGLKDAKKGVLGPYVD